MLQDTASLVTGANLSMIVPGQEKKGLVREETRREHMLRRHAILSCLKKQIEKMKQERRRKEQARSQITRNERE